MRHLAVGVRGVRLRLQRWSELCDPVLQPRCRPGDRESRDRRAVVAEDGRGHRGEADLELVDRRRVAVRADLVRLRMAAAAEGEEALAVGGELEGDTAADPVGDADEVRGVLLREVLDAARAGDREVDRLAGGVGKAAEGPGGELCERLRRVAARVAEEDGARSEPSALAEALDQAAALERADETRGRALREAGALGELADRRRLGGLDDAHEQLRCAVDRLGAGGLGRHLTWWNERSNRSLADPRAAVNRAARRVRPPLRSGTRRGRGRTSRSRRGGTAATASARGGSARPPIPPPHARRRRLHATRRPRRGDAARARRAGTPGRPAPAATRWSRNRRTGSADSGSARLAHPRRGTALRAPEGRGPLRR